MDQQTTRQQRTRERREERAERILDTTMELVLKWGYRKTTLDDIARHADVGKGTLFLHWRNRDALFASLLRRERVRMLTALRDTITDAPDQLTLHGFVRHFVRALGDRPILTALVVGDRETLGRLAERKRATGESNQIRDAFATLIDAWRARGLVRDDQSTTEQWFIFTATFYGHTTLSAMAPESQVPPAERVAELCAGTVSRALAPSTSPDPARQAEFGTVALEHLDEIRGVAEQRYLASLETRGPGESE